MESSLLRAVHCTYEFRPAKIYPGGVNDSGRDFVVDWTSGPTENRRYLVQPGAMVWIRVRESVAMPNDACGLWLQTNTLSRKGLLLINTSLVEPGYCGPLSCHFVNFGKIAVEIYAETALAKLLILKLDVAAAEPFEKAPVRYDEMIAGLAAQSAKSFLQVSEISARFEESRQRAEDDLKRAADAEFQKLRDKLEVDSQKRRLDESEAIKKDVGSFTKKTLGGAFAVILVLGGIDMGIQWFQKKLSGDEAIDQRVERALARHVTLSVGQTNSATTGEQLVRQPSPPTTSSNGRDPDAGVQR